MAIHSYGPSGVRDAVRAGADSVEHGADLDDETLAEMAKRGTVWVPTVDHNRYYIDAERDYGFAPGADGPLQRLHRRAISRRSRARSRQACGSAMGSDAVYSMFGQNTRELAWFVKAGMTPRAGSGDGDDDPGSAAAAGASARPRRAGLLRRSRRRGRRPARLDRRAVHRRPLGHEGRKSGG